MNTAPIRALVAVDGIIDPRTVESILDDPGLSIVGVVDQDAGVPGPEVASADVLLVACGAPAGAAVDFVSAATRGHERPVVVVCAGNPNGFVRDVLTSGADDIVLVDSAPSPGPETFFAMQKALARRASVSNGEGHGSLVCVLGPKGGIGKTLTATNLGVALADAGRRAVVVDLDLQFGDAGLALGLHPERTIYDLATSGGVLDAQKVDGFLAEHESGLRVLLAPVRPDQAGAVTVEFLRDLYSTLTSAFEYVVVDTPPGFTPEVIATIDAAASICMMGMLDAPSLKNTKLGMETLGLMGYPPDRVRVVLNRADSNVGISHADVVGVLGRAPDVLIPSQREVVRHINAGEPIVTAARRSEPAKALRALSDLVVADLAPVKPASNGGRRLRRRG